jgi:hypothetical protein
MFPDDSYNGFDKYPENKTGPSGFRLLLPFIAQIVEHLLHGLPEPLSKAAWIESEEFLVESAYGLWLIHCKKSSDKASAVGRL